LKKRPGVIHITKFKDVKNRNDTLKVREIFDKKRGGLP
jgi:hypothetical protein